MRRLVTDEGAIVGALLNFDGVATDVAIRKGVVLATGGFSRNA